MLPWQTTSAKVQPKQQLACSTCTSVGKNFTMAKLHKHLEACVSHSNPYWSSHASWNITNHLSVFSHSALLSWWLPGKGNCQKCAIYFRIATTTWKLMMTRSEARAWRPHACQAMAFLCWGCCHRHKGGPFPLGLQHRFAIVDVTQQWWT